MSWTRKADPLAPTPPAFHHPDRCMNCGHLSTQHHDDVGCVVEGGTKYMEDEEGNAIRACTCEAFIPAPKAPKEGEQIS